LGDDAEIVYFSAHRYDDGGFYPGGTDGAPSTVGTGTL
jgi:acetoin utilization deacetylase AcuC-like enzyme